MKCGVNNSNDWFHMIENMGSQGGASSDNNGKHSEFQPVMRQNSIYNLTLDEVQNQLGDLGKPLSSMNLDELLKNVWTVEANQSVGIDNKHIGTAQAGQNALQHQASLSLTGAMSKKTVDEVWRDIQQNKDDEKKSQERQQTLGEMTLEDFLVKAGIVTESSSKKTEPVTEPKVDVDSSLAAPAPPFAPHGPWMQYPPQPHYPHPQQNLMGIYMPAGQNIAHAQPMHMGGGAPLDVQFGDGQVAVAAPVNVMGNMPDVRKPARKRGVSEDMEERSVERRQKRMIKNRESAARSRARKQAYTTELEIKVARLEEENEQLRKRRELEKVLDDAPRPPKPRYQLRRTQSAFF